MKTKAQKLLKNPKVQNLVELKQKYLSSTGKAKESLLKLIRLKDPKFKG